MPLKLVSIVAFVVMVLAILLLAYNRSLLGESPIPIAVQVLALGLMIWARVTFGIRSFHASANPTSGGIVTSGPYKFLRHPIYASLIYFTWAGVLSHLSLESLLWGVCLVLGAGIRIFIEEKLLFERYPEYGKYAARTRRVIPFVI